MLAVSVASFVSALSIFPAFFSREFGPFDLSTSVPFFPLDLFYSQHLLKTARLLNLLFGISAPL
jgi:hypothetical protein